MGMTYDLPVSEWREQCFNTALILLSNGDRQGIQIFEILFGTQIAETVKSHWVLSQS